MIITLYSTDVTMLEVGTGVKKDTTVLQTQTVELTPGKSAPILKEEVKQRIITAMADTYSRQIQGGNRETNQRCRVDETVRHSGYHGLLSYRGAD
jgi:hypothetical protein